MATPAHTKYYLKTLHEEIDLFDRKLAHLLKYEAFNTDEDRKASAGKLAAKRELLARAARQLVSEGIEFKDSDLPRSFRSSDAASDAAPEIEQAPAAQTPAITSHLAQRPLATGQSPSPFAGTALDGQANIAAYKRSRTKAAPSQA